MTVSGRSPQAGRAGRAGPEPASSLGHSATIPNADPFRDDERVSLGDGCYISGKKANELARMAAEAALDTRPRLSLGGMSPDIRRLALTIWPAPYSLSLGEMSQDEMVEHLTMVSDYNKAKDAAQGIEAGTATTAGRGPKDESPVANGDAPK